MAHGRAYLTATLLSDGSVLVVGGNDCCGPLAETELYYVGTNAWSAGPPLNEGRQAPAATLLLDNRVLVVGGAEAVSAEIYSALVRDHKTDANGDGYSAADEETAANCDVANCSSIVAFGTAETRTCKDAGRNCGSPGAPADDVVPARVAVPPADGYGCDVALDTVGSKKTTKLAQSDIDLDGAVTILDLSKVASWFGNVVNASPADPRWEGNLDDDGFVTILDLSAMAGNFYRSVAGNCLVE